jgi:hypothetical protein
MLNMEKINSLCPLIIRMSGSIYELEMVCVETGCAKINVCGKLQNCQWSEFSMILDWDMNEYDPDLFYDDCDDPLIPNIEYKKKGDV